MRTFWTLTVAALAGAGLTAVLLALAAVEWRYELVRHKALGRLPGVAWTDLLGGMLSEDPLVNRGPWTLGYVRLVGAAGPEPCPAEWSGPWGSFRADLTAEWDLEGMTRKYLGLTEDARNGLLPRVDPGDVVVEVGGWVGGFTRYALSRGAGQVIVVEPVPQNLACLRLTFAAEIASGRVRLVEGAAWSQAGQVALRREGPNNFSHSTEGYNVHPDGELRVRAFGLDELPEVRGLERLDLIHMDIEGAERHALAGATETIRRLAPRIVVCIHHLPDDEAAILELMAEIQPTYRVRKDSMHALFH